MPKSKFDSVESFPYKIKLGDGFFLVEDEYHVRGIFDEKTNKLVDLCNDKMFPKPFYLFFDTETTGLPQDYDAPSSDLQNWPRLVQLSWILTDSSLSILSKQDYIIFPQDFTIPTNASNFHGITTSLAEEEGVNIETVIQNFIMDLTKAKYIVGHNVSFDKKIVGAEMIRLGLRDIMAEKKDICTMEITTDFCKIPGNNGFKWPTLLELHKTLFGYEFEDAHNSMCDVKATLKCFEELYYGHSVLTREKGTKRQEKWREMLTLEDANYVEQMRKAAISDMGVLYFYADLPEFGHVYLPRDMDVSEGDYIVCFQSFDNTQDVLAIMTEG